MTVREELEWQEHKRLNPLAAFADQSRGRLRFEEPRAEDVRTCYQRDIDRIVHSKSFRRLMHKTQVFLQPEGDHYRTRMTHTLEVSRIAGTITRALGLNEDLAEAIAMGHDLGHTPFGHAGEDVLSQCLGKPFRHNEQSLRVVDILEKDGQGLNLTYEVRMGILGHTGDYWPETLEGQAVRRSDQIAYVNHDIDDAIRAGILTDDDIPIDITDVLGPQPPGQDQHTGLRCHPHLPGIRESLSVSRRGQGAQGAALVHVYQCLPQSGGQGRGEQGKGYAEAAV